MFIKSLVHEYFYYLLDFQFAKYGGHFFNAERSYEILHGMIGRKFLIISFIFTTYSV